MPTGSEAQALRCAVSKLIQVLPSFANVLWADDVHFVGLMAKLALLFATREYAYAYGSYLRGCVGLHAVAACNTGTIEVEAGAVDSNEDFRPDPVRCKRIIGGHTTMVIVCVLF